jgi:membrane protein YdbS with pleckstrin-like domain
MWDLGMQPGLTSIAANFADVLVLLVLLFVVIVGIAASLVIRETIRYRKFRETSSKVVLLLRKRGALRRRNLMS